MTAGERIAGGAPGSRVTISFTIPPPHDMVYHDRGCLLERLGWTAEALANYDRVLERSPVNTEVLAAQAEAEPDPVPAAELERP